MMSMKKLNAFAAAGALAATACLPSSAMRRAAPAAAPPAAAPAMTPAAEPSATAKLSLDTNEVTPLDSVVISRSVARASSVGDPPTDMVVRLAGSSVVTPATAAPSTADVQKRAVEVFGDSAISDSAVAGSAPRTGADEPSWDIDVHSYESTTRVAHYVQVFSGPARERIEESLDRGTRYEPMIRAAFRRGGLPEDLYYLAGVESAFDADAYSRAAAVGMWQFMTSTARDLGLRVDWWIDERRDPVRSTDAAVRFIKDLQEQFGSLYLAAAAYNGGPGRISRGLDRYADDLQGTTGDDLFFALADKDYLKHETRDYVPQLIAVALVGKDPAQYGLTIKPGPPFVYDSVTVGPNIALAAVATAAGVSVERIRELNPQILRGMTPPSGRTMLRVPVGSADSLMDVLRQEPADVRAGLRSITTRKGQTVASIAQREGISAKQLAGFNPRLHRYKSGRLAPDQVVLVPSRAVIAAERVVPDPAIERYTSESRNPGVHVVKHGENLSTIAAHHHTTVKALMKANHLKRTIVFPGQSLALPRSGH
jgi:membrane-bound lytic murein transglycosylase D